MSNNHITQPRMIQHHYILSQDVCLNHVPTCTMHKIVPQPIPSSASTMYHKTCINYVPKQLHQSCTTMYLYHIPYHVPTMQINHVHQPCTSIHVPYTIPCANHEMYLIYHIKHQNCTIPCTIIYVEKVIPRVYLNQVPSLVRDVSYVCTIICQVYISIIYQYQW
jgi:hypothetical protein